MRRGGRSCLRRVSWTLRAGERWVLAGPSGAGKSTLIDALRGEVQVASGNLSRRLRGRNAAMAPADAIAHVQFDSQRRLLCNSGGYHQSRWHSGEDAGAPTAAEVLRRCGAGAVRLARSLGLGAALCRRVAELSNGERRKLLVAGAMAAAPAVLVLDRPAAGLDAASRRGLSAMLCRLAGGGTSVVVTAGRLEEIPAFATHVLCLDAGRVVASGPRRQVLALAAVRRTLRSPRPAARRRARVARPGAPVIELRGVTVRYDGKPLLSRVSFTVRRGERWGILGANGAGKTTLLSLVLADNPQAFSNAVALFGRQRGSGETIWDIKRRIGAVSPEAHLYHDHGATALEVVCSGCHDAAGLYWRAGPAELRRALAWLRRVGLAAKGRRLFRDLAEGEQRLALLARALVKEPELLVLDEPCQGLDGTGRARFHSLLDSLARRPGLSMLYVTHEEHDIPASVTHGLWLDRGRVAACGDIGSVIRAWNGGGER